MILVTGAAGKTGLALIGQLLDRREPVRAFVRSQAQADKLRALGVSQAVAGDLRDRHSLRKAAAGVQVIYHICPNMSPDEIAIGHNVIEAGRAAGVERLVYHSVLHPQTEEMPHHWHKLFVEAALFKSGLPFTILQPAAYMQNILAGWQQIIDQGAYTVPYHPETRLGMVDLLDVAEAAAIVLTGTGHQGATYELAGPETLTQSEVAARLGHQLGRPVRAEQISIEEWRNQARKAGLGAYQMDALVDMFHYYDRYGFWGNPRVLAHLLDRPPTPFDQFLQRTTADKD